MWGLVEMLSPARSGKWAMLFCGGPVVTLATITSVGSARAVARGPMIALAITAGVC